MKETVEMISPTLSASWKLQLRAASDRMDGIGWGVLLKVATVICR